MELFWFTSSPQNTAAHLLPIDSVRIFSFSDGIEPVAFRTGFVVVEVLDDSDAAPASDLIEGLNGKVPVWIYQQDGSVADSVAWMKAGVSNFLSSPNALEEALGGISSEPMENQRAVAGLIGRSQSIQSVVNSIRLVADRRCNILIEGETGTGKEVVASAIHSTGARSRGPWVAVNCGAIPDTLLEAELFGHVRGAFTGAVQARPGKFETANHGTIFLDEIGDMPFAIQAKLLRVLQEKEVERLGGNERIKLDVRVIAATNLDLAQRVKDGLFRQDLYYRLNVFRIALAPLRERQDDIPDLALHFIARISAAENARPKMLDRSAIDQLLTHDWPGNARELENVMEMALILSGPRQTIYASDIRIARAAHSPAPGTRTLRVLPQTGAPAQVNQLPAEGLNYQQALEAFEHDLLTQAIARTRGNKTAAADLLRLKRTTLSARMRVLESRLPRLVA